MPDTNVQLTTLQSLAADDPRLFDSIVGSRPLVEGGEIKANSKRTPQIVTARGLVLNSMLQEKEWVVVDRAVMQAAVPPLIAVNELRSRGLVVQMGSIGAMTREWYMQSEMSAAEVSMTGQSRSLDQVDLKLTGAPIPVIFKDFIVDARTLAASRLMGTPLDTTNASAAARVVAEKMEDLLLNGADVTLAGRALYGLRTHPNRNTDTAGNYTGGDWGTIDNIHKTVSGMIQAAVNDDRYGPYMLFAAKTQYQQAAHVYYTDGSGQTPADRIRAMPEIAGFKMLPRLTDGDLLLVEMSPEVVEWNETLDIQTREWVSGDGMTTNFKVIAIGGPAIKADYANKSGIVHATGA